MLVAVLSNVLTAAIRLPPMLPPAAVRRCILRADRLSPHPLKLLAWMLAWLPVYLIVSNYLERSLLPFRLMCYTQSDMLSDRPLRGDLESCTGAFFGDRRPSTDCHLDRPPRVLVEPRMDKGVESVLVIRTGPGSIDYRQFIRTTWKNSVESRGVPVVFVCATSARAEIAAEAEQYGDILQFDFADSYHNLSWKMMAIYGYVLDHLNNTSQIVVINDDTIVNATALVDVMERGRGGREASMIGKVSRGYPRLFMPWLTWHVSGHMYPNLCYPRFTQGSSFILSRAGARELLEHVCAVPFVHLDDVFMGVLSSCTGLRQIHNEGFDKHVADDFVVYHYQYSRHSPDTLRRIWEGVRESIG